MYVTLQRAGGKRDAQGKRRPLSAQTIRHVHRVLSTAEVETRIRQCRPRRHTTQCRPSARPRIYRGRGRAATGRSRCVFGGDGARGWPAVGHRVPAFGVARSRP
jgi:hypothetical protein